VATFFVQKFFVKPVNKKPKRLIQSKFLRIKSIFSTIVKIHSTETGKSKSKKTAISLQKSIMKLTPRPPAMEDS
jgi:hypothetical protein